MLDPDYERAERLSRSLRATRQVEMATTARAAVEATRGGRPI